MDNSGEIGLAAGKLAKIDNVQGQKRTWLGSDDRRVARIARQQ
jgi:hypothetical protein